MPSSNREAFQVALGGPSFAFFAKGGKFATAGAPLA
jgi:hypothetical protein